MTIVFLKEKQIYDHFVIIIMLFYGMFCLGSHKCELYFLSVLWTGVLYLMFRDYRSFYQIFAPLKV